MKNQSSNNVQTGRNDPCPCGSGKKYKHCCLSNKPSLAVNTPTKTNRPSTQELNAALSRTWQLQQAGNVELATQICHQILSVLPTQSEALHILGVIALQDGDVEQAIALFTKAIRHDAKHFILLANLGLAYHEQGNLVLAEQQYHAALKINPNYVNALFNLHALKIIVTRINHSIEILSKLLLLAPKDLEAHFALGVLLDYANNASQAAQHFTLASSNNPLMQARFEAWQYLKSAQTKLPVVTGSMMQTFELAMNAAKLEGLVLEFGVRHGNSIRQLAKLTKQAIHGFDSFEGLPDVWHHEPKGSYTTKGVVPTVPKQVKLHVGWFDATLPNFLNDEAGVVRLLNIDCDIYNSTKTIFEQLASRIVSGTVIVFDEYIGNLHWREDEFKAFQEAVASYGWRYEYLAFSFFTKQVVVRIL